MVSNSRDELLAAVYGIEILLRNTPPHDRRWNPMVEDEIRRELRRLKDHYGSGIIDVEEQDLQCARTLYDKLNGY